MTDQPPAPPPEPDPAPDPPPAPRKTYRPSGRAWAGIATLTVVLGGLVGVALVSDDEKAAVSASTVKIGMSASVDTWAQRLSETGPVYARRLFGQLSSTSSTLNLARSETAAGRMPILSFKVPNNDWAGVAAGRYDTQLRSLAASLAAIPGPVFVALHHEPAGDGTAANFVAMQRHAIPILGEAANVDAGVIANGWWWSATGQGYTDAEIAAWLPQSLLDVAEVVAADTYQAGDETNPGEDGGVKARRLSAWATRVGVERLGIGEYNGFTAPAVKNVGDAVLADPRYVFAAVWNNNGGLGRVLTGDRLQAFKNTRDASVATPPTTTTTTTVPPTTTTTLPATTTTTLPPTTTTTEPPTTTTTLPPTTTTTTIPLARCEARWDGALIEVRETTRAECRLAA